MSFARTALFATAASLISTGAASAQDTGTALEEIVVTAQRRSENLQDVPISVTAVTAAALARSGITGTDALSQVTPGLNMARAGGRVPVAFIRGVGSPVAATGLESPVATYVDGVYYAEASGNIFQFNNIERIEVLKGPQGTLFGRNATGGLINVVTRDPTTTPTLMANVSYGNFKTFNGSLYLSGGAGKVAMDLAVFDLSQAKGFGRSLVTGDDVNKQQEAGVRSKILVTFDEANRLTLSADWYSSKGDYGINSNAYPGSLLTGGVPLRNSIFDRQGNFRAAAPVSDHRTLSAKYVHDFSWGKFTTLAAWRRNLNTYTIDQDGTPTRVTDTTSASATRTLQYESFLTGAFDKLDWTAGVFVFDSRAAYIPVMVRGTAAAANTNTNSRQDTISYAGYLQATYALTPSTRVTGGIRYTVDRRRFAGVQTAQAGHPQPVGTALASRRETTKFSRPTWRLAIDQKLSEDVMAYASYNRGFKSGVFNLTSVTAPALRPETLDAYEAGVKSELFERILRLNVAGFWYDYSDIQLNRAVPGGTQLFNAASGRIKGLEVEATLAPPVETGRVLLSAGLSVLDAKYRTFPNGPFTTPNANGGNTVSSRDLSGNRMIRAPKWTASASADWRVPAGPGELGLNATYLHTAAFFWDPDNRLKQGAYDLVNAQISYEVGKYRVRVFGQNLTDKRYLAAGSATALGDFEVPGRPRTYGIGLEYTY